MMRKRQIQTLVLTATVAMLASPLSIAEVVERNVNSTTRIAYVSDDSWQPEGVEIGTPVPATWTRKPQIVIDGIDDEAAWALADEVEVPLSYGNVSKAWLKAVYTDEEVFIRVRWEDATEDREHHPWTWDDKNRRYVAGPQVEDSVMLSFEAGCEWTPSLLGGYIYDFDAWHWMAARSDPLGQAVDLYGNVQDREIPEFHPYPSRVVEDEWIVKITENHGVDVTADWYELDRVYMLQPVTKDLWIKAVPDGGRQAPPFVQELPAPSAAPRDASVTYPQFSPVKLTGSAAEVAASGRWEDGFWTVEFRRARHTPAEHIYDTIFNRLVQFSVHVFDRAELIDEASESPRLFLRFMPPEQALASN